MSHRTISRSSSDEEKDKVAVAGTALPQLKSETSDEMPAEADEELDKREIPMRYRLAAFSMILFFATGSSYCESTISPIKSILRKELKITNAQYGAITSASSLVNTILPIVGGIGIDYWGATYAAMISSVFILVGAVVSAAGANTTQYGLVIGGRILMGFGSTVIESTQNKLYAHWFAGSHLALIIGVDIAWSRITSIISRSTAVPMTTINGWWGWALWIPAIVTAVNLGITVAYWAFERNVPKAYRPPLGKNAHAREGALKRKITWNTLTQLPVFFWILCGTQLFQSSAVGVYTGNLADIQTQTRGTSTLAAGYNSSLQSVIPIILTPLTGMFFDRYGWRTFFVSWTGMMYIIVFVLIGLTTVHPLAPILISSFALSTNAITFIASIPVLVGDDRLLGTAYGVWKAFNNGGSIVLDVAAGAIQDRSSDNSYDNVIYLIIAIKALQVCWGPFYDFLDGRWLRHSLRRGENERIAIRQEVRASKEIVKGWSVSKTAMIAVLSLLGALTVTAWVVYIVYSLGT